MSTALARSEIAAALALAIAREAANPDAELIAEAARLHEVGKLYVPAELLYARPADLDQPQREQLAGHPVHGHALTRGAGVPDRACAWILNARERWDGSGPTGLGGTDIPFGSRVIAVCREYLDAPLESDPGAVKDPRATALGRLRSLGGNGLDPELAEIGAELAAPAPNVTVRDATDADREMVAAQLAERNATRTARNGELVDPLEHPMLLAESGGELAGLLTWIDDGECVEILNMYASEPGQGVGTALGRGAGDTLRSARPPRARRHDDQRQRRRAALLPAPRLPAPGPAAGRDRGGARPPQAVDPDGGLPRDLQARRARARARPLSRGPEGRSPYNPAPRHEPVRPAPAIRCATSHLRHTRRSSPSCASFARRRSTRPPRPPSRSNTRRAR